MSPGSWPDFARIAEYAPPGDSHFTWAEQCRSVVSGCYQIGRETGYLPGSTFAAPQASLARAALNWGPRWSAAFGAELPEEAAVIGAREFLAQLAIIIEAEDVDQVHDNRCACRGKRAGWRLGELAHERALDPRLARHGVALGHDDAPGDLPVVEGGADRCEVGSNPA